MNRDHVDRFCSRVCAHVRFSPDHAAITAELTAHLEDHAAALEARGLSPEEAAAQAVTAMGCLLYTSPRTPRRRGHGGRRAAAAERCLFDAIGLI